MAIPKYYVRPDGLHETIIKINGKRTQHIHIQYDGIGFIPLEELLKEETA